MANDACSLDSRVPTSGGARPSVHRPAQRSAICAPQATCASCRTTCSILHGEIGSNLTVVQLQLDDLASDLLVAPRGELGQRTHAILELVQATIDRLRAILVDADAAACPKAGLVAELRAWVERVDVGRIVRFQSNQRAATDVLAGAVERAFLWIAQESIGNALKHANASRIDVSLERNGERMRLEVRDDGCGFGPGWNSAGRFGIRNMQEYASSIGARLNIDTEAGSGVAIVLEAGCSDPTTNCGCAESLMAAMVR